MPKISPSLLPELDQELANTRKALERIEDARLDWRPHEKSWTLRELATHLSQIPWWGATTLAESSFDVAPGGKRVEAPELSSRDEILQRFDATRDDLRAAVEGTTDEAWQEGWTLLSDGATVFTLPRIAVFRSMVLNHMIHHRGQLTVYLRMTGAKVPSLYGPSADERP